ncbi:MAG: sulfite exporter TauE/SafE family protein [Bacteroidota bacterium]
MEIFGYIGALVMGLTLGLLGGGGSILTVPILVYLFGISPVLATAYSLFIVGTTSLVGSFQYHTRKLISYRTAIVFGIPSVITVYLTRAFVVPAIPQEIVQIGSFPVTKDVFIMSLFAILMVFAAVGMFRKSARKEVNSTESKEISFNYPAILMEGLVVGLLTGLVGAGGGFLIIPALVIFSKLDMKLAVGTSLLIIAAKSLIGFLGDVANYDMDWTFLGTFILIAIAGIFIGNTLSKKISASKLKFGFGVFVLLMGGYILVNELILN